MSGYTYWIMTDLMKDILDTTDPFNVGHYLFN